ncbi:hypothetical protein IW261DRAFT_1483767 [Armillaria novae-zelandiae]|uniref:Uncharacterized protein n=1 Tax=Armillaria novae-zelandiae TaxID=153914 RepID=A0AA39P7U8_9AGAR|nr:hypothetical protein IW261DRAFT_1483767 [Armillaria novae-zelandiae]
MPVQVLQLALRVILFVSLSSVFAPHVNVLASPSMPLALMNYARSGPQSMVDFSKRNDTLLAYRDDGNSNLDRCDELADSIDGGSSLEKDRRSDYQDRCVESLNSCKGILSELNLAIAAMRPDDKGLGNYDRNDRLETLLKEVVNQTKDLLKVTVILVNNIPIVGPILGPIVYELKCITEEILDAIEDITDGLLNFLNFVLKPLVSPCKGVLGIDILGICI